MVSQAETGDVLFFHYSGHGPRFPSLMPAHIFRQDEAIVPSDFNLIMGINSSDISTHLLESFGADASLKFLAPQLKYDLFEFFKANLN
ncbi:hypothetical protein V6N12_018112 [Hibiscus sabdariffa]|uniref:Peptidase C14 caspase domain-containing protein n=1 Tax=Hibiscus sabdariffa TaxID=183260 RepID=A0ABR2AL91_9ROSI